MSQEINILDSATLVSMTDKKGVIIYANDHFCESVGYSREELVGKPHNINRHQDMPRVVFKLLWDRVLKGEVVYAFVKNKAKNGNFYWVKAYIQPVIRNGEIVKIISYRRAISEYAKEFFTKFYADVKQYEETHSLEETQALLDDYLDERHISYEQFIDRITLGKKVESVSGLSVDKLKIRNAHILFKYKILGAVNRGEKNISVTPSCDCLFGKWIKSVEGESFTHTPAFKIVVRHHNAVHETLEDYVQSAAKGASASQLESIVKHLPEHTQAIFENINKAVDNTKE